MREKKSDLNGGKTSAFFAAPLTDVGREKREAIEMIEKVISHLHQISFIFSQLPLKIVIIAHENDPKWDEIELEK